MICELRIRNYILIDQLALQFRKGLTIITGETGAGKSILLGALSLILGDRAESDLQADPTKKAVLEAVFSIGDYGLEAFFRENDLDYSDQMLIRRELLPQGKSRAFINDTPVNLQTLKNLGRFLIDIHQQFDQLDVLEPSFQLQMLDALAGQRPLLQEYKNAFARWRELQSRIAERIAALRTFNQEQDFLQFQLRELEEAALIPDEWPGIADEEKRLRNAAEIHLALFGAGRLILEEERSPLDQLRSVLRILQPLRKYHADLDALALRLEQLLPELQDWGESAQDLAEHFEPDPTRLAAIESRINLLQKLMHKHHVNTSEALVEIRDQIAHRLGEITHHESELASLEREETTLQNNIKELASRISNGRRKAIRPFLTKLTEWLKDLRMEHFRLRMDIEAEPTPGPWGMDRIFFGMTQTDDERYVSVKQAASGGELSRLTLVIKSIVAAAIPLPTLVFDEIDAGVSGAVSMRVGDILTHMANGHQLIVITHSPQIAAKAGKHLFVRKTIDNGTVQTTVQDLEGEDRVYAVATMLGDDPPGAAALANARELLGV